MSREVIPEYDSTQNLNLQLSYIRMDIFKRQYHNIPCAINYQGTSTITDFEIPVTIFDFVFGKVPLMKQ